MLSVAAGSLGSICILFLTGAARAAHAHPCLSSAAPFHGAFEFTDRTGGRQTRNLSAAGAAGEIARCSRSEIGGCAAIEIIACGNIEIAVARRRQCYFIEEPPVRGGERIQAGVSEPSASVAPVSEKKI